MANVTETYDVVVSGAGIVGRSAALTFANHGYQTLLLDNEQTIDTYGKFSVDLRTVALSPVSVMQLQELGAELPANFCPIAAMHVWERDGSASIHMSATEVNAPYLAAVLENQALTRLIPISHANLEAHFNTHIESIDLETRGITLKGGNRVDTDLLIVAEGANSLTCRKLGVGYDLNQDLQQRAIVTIVETTTTHDCCAWQVFSPTPLALLPLKNSNLRSLIWSIASDEALALLKLSDQQFASRVSVMCGSVLGKVSGIDRRLSFPLHQRMTNDFNPYPWVLLLGDAARTIHPLAGQGVNLGLEDVRGVRAILTERPKRLNQPHLWRAFNAKRQLRSRTMAQLMKFFSTIYALQSPFARLIRNTGVHWVNENPGLKRQLIREAMGYGPIASVL